MRWPFGKKADKKTTTGEASEPAAELSALERLLSKDCNRDEFVLLCVKLIQERLPDAEVEMIGETAIRIKNAEGKESTTYFDNAWIAYSRKDEESRTLIERHIRVASSLLDPAGPLLSDQIVALIKDSEYVESLNKTGNSVLEHMCGDLWIVYAVDKPESMSSLARTDMAAAGIAEENLRNLALENLRRIMPSVEQHGDGPWYGLFAGGDYTASLLLFDSVWDQVADSIEGDIVAVVPARDTLLFTGSESPEGLKMIKEQANYVVTTGNYIVSDTLIVRKDGRWEVFNAN
jgi:uncharacterized protein YtpQ (UPF0354 family)